MLDLTRPPPDRPASATRRIELHSRITVDPKTGYSPELKARVEAEIARGKTFEPLAATDGDDAIPPRPELDPLDALEHDQPSIDLVLPGLAAGSVGSIISPGGAGKSILALELSLLITTGFDLSGFAAGGTYKRGAVGIAAAEDPVPAIAQRLRSIGRDHLTPEQRQVFGRAITIEPLAGMKVNIMQRKWFNFFMRFAEGKRIVFLDTLRCIHLLEENDSGQMADLIGTMGMISTQTGCALVFLHHTSKSSAINGQGGEQQAARGSSVLTDNIRWQAFLAGCTKADAKEHDIEEARRGFFVRVGISKQNFGVPVPEVWMRRVDGGVLVPAHLKTTSQVASRRSAKSGGKQREES